jgi:tripartite ATP-independent transporter DctP family solute receptor
MKKSAALLGFVIGLAFMISGWGLVPHLYAAPVEIKLAHGDPADLYTSKKAAGSTIFKQMVENETGGAVEVKLFPAGQLGNEREIAEGVKLGTLQMGMLSGPLANYFKAAQVLDIPYLFSSYPVAWKVMDGWFGKELAAACLKETGMRILAYDQVGFRNFTNSTRPIKSPADIKGMKIRVMESPVYLALIRSLGASPTPIPWTETYTALQQKVADGQENPVTSIKFAKLYEVQKYLTLDGHTYGVSFILINEKFFQSLPKETQTIVKTVAQSAALCSRGIDTIDSTIGTAFLKEKGMEIYVPTAKELAQFRQATQKPVIEYLEKQIGKTWIDKVMKAVKEAEADVAKGI